MERLLEVALDEYGVAEKSGEPDADRILAYADESSVPDTTADETPWCSIFMNWVAETAGYEASEQQNARSWLNVGRPVETPVPGDVVVFWRESRDSWKGHVGVYVGHSQDGSQVHCLGGNQDDRVDISAYDVDRVLGFRRLRQQDPSVPSAPLERGDTGPEVRRLQSLLNQNGFEAGPVDSIYGPMTEAGVKRLQSTTDDVDIDGVYDAATRDFLASLL